MPKRDYNPATYARMKRQMKARGRAFYRLADLHRADYLRILNEEQWILDVEAAEEADQAAQTQHGRGVENYLFVGGDKMAAQQAADRLGVTPKSVERYKAALREAS